MTFQLKIICSAFIMTLFFAACTESPTTPQIDELELEQEMSSLHIADVTVVGESVPNEMKERVALPTVDIISACHMPTVYVQGNLKNVFNAYFNCTSFPQATYNNCTLVDVQDNFYGEFENWENCIRAIDYTDFPMSGGAAQHLYNNIMSCINIPEIDCDGHTKKEVRFENYVIGQQQYIAVEYIAVSCCTY